ncbi:MAG: serine hydrolase domain-containing protein [Geminicoccaceae bacterium]
MEHAAVDPHGRLIDDSSQAVVPWWSFTKTLIAACALRLVEQGRLDLDRPLPERPYTLRQLLRHRAGVGNYGGLADYHAAVARRDPPWPQAELLARIPVDRLIFPPDQGWAYSNVGYLIVGRLIEDSCGEGLGPALGRLVLRPLGLEVARLAETTADMDATAFAGGHGYDPGWVYHGTVIGPVAEAALALHRLLGGGLLTAASLAAMLERHPLGGPIPDRPWRSTGYGLGLMIGTMARRGLARSVEVAGHSAGGPGSVGAVYRAMRSGCTAAVFAAGTGEGAVEDRALSLLTCD